MPFIADPLQDASPSADPGDSSRLISHQLQRSRDEVPLYYASRMPRTVSSSSISSLPQYQDVFPSYTRDRAGSVPVRSQSLKQRSIIMDEHPKLPRISMSREPSEKSSISEIARPATDGSPDGLVKRSRSQKLKHVMGFTDNRSQPVVQPQSILPWALRKPYQDQVETDSNGNVWGTLDALVDKLLTDAPPRDPVRESIHRIHLGLAHNANPCL